MGKTRKISSTSRARKNLRGATRPKRRSDSVDTFLRALEQAHLDILLIERSHPSNDTSSPVYSPFSQPIIPPSGTRSPRIVESQLEDQSTSSSESVRQFEPLREGPTAFIGVLYISLILGSLLHSWWVLGGCLLIGLIFTQIVVLSEKSLVFNGLMIAITWLLFASIWAYIGWLVCDAYMPFVIHLLCAIIGFMLGLVGYMALGSFTNATKSKQAQELKSIQEAKYAALTTFIDAVCVSAALGYLLHSWWILAGSLLVGLILTRIIALSTKDNVYALSQIGVTRVWLIFALTWGYAGWFILDAHISSIVHFLCALVGFVLGLIGYTITYSIVSPRIVKGEAVGETEQ